MRFGGRRPPLAPDPDLIRSLAKLLDETGLGEIEYAVGDRRIRVAREGSPTPASGAAILPSRPPEPAPPSPLNGANGHDKPNEVDHPGTLKAPLVGIAYLAAEPGSPPYVKVGDTVAEGQILLIIEAMKVMNPIPAPEAGTVEAVLISDGQPVEFGEPLMVIR